MHEPSAIADAAPRPALAVLNMAQHALVATTAEERRAGNYMVAHLKPSYVAPDLLNHTRHFMTQHSWPAYGKKTSDKVIVTVG